MSEKLSPGAQARAARDAEFAARFGSGAQPKAVVPKADPAAPARSRAVAIRAGLTSWAETRRLIMEARQAEDWIALGYASFELYCDGEFSMKSLRLTAQERDDAIIAFRSAGMTFREIGAATGTSKNTAQRALKAAEVDHRVPDGTKLPQVEALRQAIEDATVSKDSFACEVCGKKLAAGIVRAAQTRCLKCDPNRDHFSTEVGGPCLACPTDTSGAVPPASTEGVAGALGEGEAASLSSVDSPGVGVAPPSSSGGTDSPTADPLSDSSSHAGVPAVGGQTEERDEEQQQRPWDVVWTSVGNGAEIDRQTFGSYQLALAEMERSRRAGSIAVVDIEPTPTDSPTGLEAAQPRDDRSETDFPAGRDRDANGAALSNAPEAPAIATADQPGIDHHDGAGVSLSGEALPVESAGALLEDGDAAVTPSSSDPDDERDEPSATDLLLMTFGALIKLIDHMDVEAVASMLFPAELEQLHQHSEALAAFVAKVSRIRFEALTRTP